MSECRFHETGRGGLYLLVLIILLQSCRNADRLSRIQFKLEQMAPTVEQTQEAAE